MRPFNLRSIDIHLDSGLAGLLFFLGFFASLVSATALACHFLSQ